MKSINCNNQTLVHSVIWALIILLASYLLSDTQVTSSILTLMIGGWFCSHSMLQKNATSLGEAKKCKLFKANKH
jgi:hypothetical protein